MERKSDNMILVTGATGKQGGAVAKNLLLNGFKVKALTRNGKSVAAKKLKDAGAEIAEGDLEDKDSLDAALEGIYGVFSVQNFWEKGVGYKGEIRQARNLVDAAKKAEVKHFVQASVADAEAAPGVLHFECKFVIENYLMESDIPYTIVREVFFMDNFLDPQNGSMLFPVLSGMLKKDTKFHMIAVEDIGKIVAVVFENPDKYIGKKINAGGDVLTVKEMKDVYLSVTGKNPRSFKIPQILAKMINGEMYRQLKWNNDPGWQFNLQETREVYADLTDFRRFLEIHQPKNL